MSRRVRAFPEKAKRPRRAFGHSQLMQEKVVSDMDAFIRQREYSKAGSLLLTVLSQGSIAVAQLWRPMIAVIRHQDHENALSSFLDIVAAETRAVPPYSATMERIFHELAISGQAYDVAVALVNESGDRLAMAHGFLGIIVAFLREMELQPEESVPADADVFRHSGFAKFALSRHREGQPAKYTLASAERHLAQALALDGDSDFFVAFHTQVLVTLDKTDEATAAVRERYQKSKNIVYLRMLMSLDPRPVADQEEYMLDYLELDPFAPEATYFCPFIEKHLDTVTELQPDTTKRLLGIVVDRIERGDPDETHKWSYLAQITAYLCPGQQGIVDTVMEPRLSWWKSAYFDWFSFCQSEATDQTIFRAVCAQQLMELEQGHPVYGILSGEMSEDQARFVDTHIFTTTATDSI
ncbi:hypothetical protein GGF46_000162 [Coemansia sp. RSA 552]|nr:hypothetical protein GGF46_000162 [Coemansia sp. RSA 552]